ncbi:TetR/AcrR family transcriptional regulator [Planctomonas sp. JC2975]|uniref:TetR/AcrR family transcriptional regulator n=1 Tax=Planctomonas sp. JC2975 TaxID=2729626 RepID=UPI0014765317|nr:TetR/AcrR family transcriptional regulator [Planctomonas sp. JC2975]NNC11728.1 TetR/AcrR family transcriptional regulator [Planctomonas sp. JC2975]
MSTRTGTAPPDVSPASPQPRRADAVRNREAALQATIALLAEPGSTLTVEAIARRAELGPATVVRAFGSKDALIDAAVAGLLAPLVDRARELRDAGSGDQALMTFLPELMAFHAAHSAIDERLAGLRLPAANEQESALVAVMHELVEDGRASGRIRTDIDSAVIATLIAETTHALARSAATDPQVYTAYAKVLVDGLRSSRAG